MPNRPPARAPLRAEEPPGGLIARADGVLSRMSLPTLQRVCLATVVVLGLLDYWSGPELSVSFLYLIPVAASAWYGASRSGYLMAWLSAGVWVAGDVLSRELPLPPLVTLWNLAVRILTFLAVAALAVRLRQAIQVVSRLALSDPLTRLANSRAFLERLAGEVDRAARYGSVFTVAYLDLDRFKEVNDTLGHAEGDQVLRMVAHTMRKTMRSSDLTARLGGDEFAILLPETPFGRAGGALAKLRAEILSAMAAAGWPVTVSVGAVTFEIPTGSAEEALKIADGLMYEVKQNGADGIRHMLWTGEPSAG